MLKIIYNAKLKGPPLKAIYIKYIRKAFYLINIINLYNLILTDNIAIAKWI